MKFLLLIPILIGFTYCSTTPSPGNSSHSTDISNSIDQEALILEDIRQLIEDGSLSSLSQSMDLLENNSAGSTEKGEFYKFVTLSLLKMVYPYSDYSKTAVVYPKSGMFSEIVSKAGKGEIVDLPNQDVSFFTLLVSSIAALYTKSDAVVGRTLDILDTIYSSDSTSFLPLYIRSFLFEKQHQYKKALDGYLKSLDIDPHSYPSELGVIRILIRNSEFKTALIHLENIQDLYGEHIMVKSLFVDALIGANKLDTALAVVSRSLTLNPDNVTMTLKYADILQKQGNDSHALRLLQAIESVNGQSAYSIRIHASIDIARKNFSLASELLSGAVKKYPEDIQLRNLYGRILLITGKSEEGRAYFEDSFKLNPESLGSLRLLVEEAISSKDWKRARQYVEKLLTIDNSNSSLRYAVKIYQNLGNNSKALDYNSRIISNGQPSHTDYFNSVNLFLKDGKTKAALELVDEWIKSSDSAIDKSYFFYLKSLALPDSQAKLDSLRQSLFENLQNLDAIIAISDIYYKLGEKRNSYRYLKQAFILAPDDESIKEKLRKMEKEL